MTQKERELFWLVDLLSDITPIKHNFLCGASGSKVQQEKRTIYPTKKAKL